MRERHGALTVARRDRSSGVEQRARELHAAEIGGAKQKDVALERGVFRCRYRRALEFEAYARLGRGRRRAHVQQKSSRQPGADAKQILTPGLLDAADRAGPLRLSLPVKSIRKFLEQFVAAATLPEWGLQGTKET